VVGVLMAGHGAQKLFGWLGGYGLSGTGGFLETLGFRPGRTFALAAGASELVGGLLIAGGLLGPVGPALVIATMIVAIGSVHVGNGLFAATNGIELPAMYAAIAAALTFTGPGAYSIDAATGLAAIWSPELTLTVLALSILGGAANLAVRRPAPVEA